MPSSVGTPSAKAIETFSKVLVPRGIHDVASLVKTMLHYKSAPGHVAVARPGGDWSWLASPARTVVTPNRVVLAFDGDYRRTATTARHDLYQALQTATLSVMSEDEAEALYHAHGGKGWI